MILHVIACLFYEMRKIHRLCINYPRVAWLHILSMLVGIYWRFAASGLVCLGLDCLEGRTESEFYLWTVSFTDSFEDLDMNSPIILVILAQIKRGTCELEPVECAMTVICRCPRRELWAAEDQW